MNLDLLTQMESEIESLTTPKTKVSKTTKVKTFTRSRADDPIGHNHYSMVVFRRNGFLNKPDYTENSDEVVTANLAIVAAVEHVNTGTWRIGEPDSDEVKAEIERCKSTAVKDAVYADLLTEVLRDHVTLNIDEHLNDANALQVRSRWIATRLSKRNPFPMFRVNEETEVQVRIIALDGVPIEGTETTETETPDETVVAETEATA